MGSTDKLKELAARLTDKEIDEQLLNFFEWAQRYKTILEDERRSRKKNTAYTASLVEVPLAEEMADTNNFFEENESIEADEMQEDALSLDYYYIQAVNNKLENMSEEELEAGLNRLRSVSTDDLSSEQVAKLQYEMETCELFLLAIRGEEEQGMTCPSCGSELPREAVFCTKCGKRL